MCDNCEYFGHEEPRDFTIYDLWKTLVRHGVEPGGEMVHTWAFYSFLSYVQNCGIGVKTEEAYQFARTQLRKEGYNEIDAQRCTRLYKQGLRALDELQKKGIKHKPRT